MLHNLFAMQTVVMTNIICEMFNKAKAIKFYNFSTIHFYNIDTTRSVNKIFE